MGRAFLGGRFDLGDELLELMIGSEFLQIVVGHQAIGISATRMVIDPENSASPFMDIAAATWKHWVRHANATLLDAVGAPLGTVQALLGHSSSEITREVYLHSLPSDSRAAVQKVEDLLIGPKLTQVVDFEKTGSSLIQ